MSIDWGDKVKSLFYNKKLLTSESIGQGFLDYVVNLIERNTNGINRNANGFYTRNVKADTFVIGTTPPTFDLIHEDPTSGGPDTSIEVSGHVLGQVFNEPHPGTVVNGILEKIPYQNDVGGPTMHVGIRPQAGVPNWDDDECIASNPRTGQFNYEVGKDRIGDWVNGLTSMEGALNGYEVSVDTSAGAGNYALVIIVDELFEFAKPAADRGSEQHNTNATLNTQHWVHVWLTTPQTSNVSDAFDLLPVTYGTNGGYFPVNTNYVVITEDSNGQVLKKNIGDITDVDVNIFKEGPTVVYGTGGTYNKDLSTDDNYVYAGAITPSAGIPTFAGAGGTWLTYDTLDGAYDGPTGSGSGKSITADSGSVDITNAVADTTDTLELVRTNPSAAAAGVKVTTTGANAHSIELGGDNTDIVLDFTSTNLEVTNSSGDKILQLSSPSTVTGLTISPDSNGLDTIADSSGVYMGDQTSDDWGSIVTTNINGTDIKTRLTVTQAGSAVPVVDLTIAEVTLKKNTVVEGTLDCSGDLDVNSGKLVVTASTGAVVGSSDVTIPAANDYKFAAAQTRYAWMPGLAFKDDSAGIFKIEDEGTAANAGRNGGVFVVGSDTTVRYGAETLNAYIPNGATLQGFKVFYNYDSGITADPTVHLYTSVIGTFTSVTSGFSITFNTTNPETTGYSTDNTAPAIVLNYQTTTYSFQFSCNNTGTAVDTILFGILLTYTLDNV